MTNSIDTDTLANLGLSRQLETQKPKDLGQEDFLELMVAQLRNQDPFSPMESGEFLGQIAQFGTVNGIGDVRTALEGLAGALSSNQAMQAAGLVDKQAYVDAREAWLPPEGLVTGAVEVPVQTTAAAVSIYDLNGHLVATQPVAVRGDDAGQFVWDGRTDDGDIAPSGYYEVRATGEIDGATTALEVLIAGRIESVAMQGQGGAVEVTVTGLGKVDLADVRRLS